MRKLLFLAVFALAVAAQPCTIFLVARNGMVLMGANEDMKDVAPYDKHWVEFHPLSDKVKVGYITFGYKIFPTATQAGMNASGLFFDYNALPMKDKGPKDRPKAGMNLGDEVLANCKTVSEALAFIAKYDFVALSAGQMVIGDATGDSAIVERDAVTRRGTLDYQIGTNFRTSETPKEKIDCWRYKACDTTLGMKGKVSVESVRKLLAEASPKPGMGAVSWYSTVCDLKSGQMLLFRKCDFSKVVRLDVAAELKKGARRVDMDELMAKQAVPYVQKG